MKIANSSLYGLLYPVDSLAQAISLIGTQTLKNIALSFVIVQAYQDAPQGSFNLDLFWRRSISTAFSAEILAEKVKCKDNDIFVSALLQDIGVLIMFLSDSAAFTEVLDNKRISGKSICNTEKEQFGFNHAETGYHLLKTWNLSDTICGPILYHHSEDPKEPYRNSARILGFADKISAIYHGKESNRKSIEVHAGLKETYQLQDEQIESIIDTIGDKSREILELFSINPGEMKPFSQIMQEANDTHGHPTGDYVLQELSRIMVKLVRNCDIVARYGGEEFAIILPDTAKVGAKVLAQRVRRGIEQHKFERNGQLMSVTISTGLASSENEGAEITRTALIADSDQALYRAKRNGKNRVEL